LKGNKPIDYKSLLAIQEQENVLEKERFEEEANLYLMTTLNKSDVFQSTLGKKYARKLMSRVNNFYKSIEETEKDTAFLLINNDSTFEQFEEYLLTRVKGKEKQGYEQAFMDRGFVNDVKNLIRIKSYEHKQQRNMEGRVSFFSPEAQRQNSILAIMKANRSFAHEANSRVGKVYLTLTDGTQGTLNPCQLEQFKKVTIPIFEDIISREVNKKLRLTPSNLKQLS